MIFDMLALNKVESQPWDIWQSMPGYQQKEYVPEYLAFMDLIAALTAGLSPGFAEVRLLYQTEKRLQPPSGWEP